MDCLIGDDLRCSVCGKAARIKSLRRNCGTQAASQELSSEHKAFIAEIRSRGNSSILGGPGTELKKLLAKFGIVAMPGCSCNAMAAKMDAAGPDGAEAMIDEVLAVMKQEAGRRGLPWVEMAARMLVKRAIRNARARK